MAKRPLPEIEFRVTIRVGPHATDLPALFDMMRYEHSTLESWEHFPSTTPSSPEFTVTLRTARVRYTPDRWASFGLFPKEAV